MSTFTITLAIVVIAVVLVSSLALIQIFHAENIQKTALKLKQIYEALQDIVYVRREEIRLPLPEMKSITMSVLIVGKTALYVDNALYLVVYGSDNRCLPEDLDSHSLKTLTSWLVRNTEELTSWLRVSPDHGCIYVLFGNRTVEMIERIETEQDEQDTVYIYVKPEGCRLGGGYVKIDVDSITVQPGVGNWVNFTIVINTAGLVDKLSYNCRVSKPITVRIVRVCGK